MSFLFSALVALFVLCLSYPTDWVNANYLLYLEPNDPNLARARAAVLRSAYTDSKGGPWTVTDTSIGAPSGDRRDYLSFAPYWWPNCLSCTPSKPNDQDDDQPASNQKRELSHSLQPTMLSTHSLAPSGLLVPAASNVTAFGFSQSASNSNVEFARKPAATAGGTRSKNCPTLSSNAPPSATWTSCTYVQRDGKVNPDVRQLNDSTIINEISQAALSLSAAWALTGESVYATTASYYIDIFFVNAQTAMNPNVQYGQVVRGPGKQQGSFMAILDLRGLVKVVNAVEIMRESSAPGWTWEIDSGLINWATRYIQWLKTSSQGQKAAAAANNHGTFFAAQMTALQILVGDLDGARQTIRDFFQGAFQDQVVASGEQPFEAIRTRPAHYRSFNIEGLLACAKMADQLGMDVWTARSKYGATIKTAVDYALSVYPRASDASTAPAQLAPQVATIAAVYGDPGGRYMAWLKSAYPSYSSKSWWLWTQPGDFAMAPTSSPTNHKRSLLSLGACEEDGDDVLVLLARNVNKAPKRKSRRARRSRKLKGLTRR